MWAAVSIIVEKNNLISFQSGTFTNVITSEPTLITASPTFVDNNNNIDDFIASVPVPSPNNNNNFVNNNNQFSNNNNFVSNNQVPNNNFANNNNQAPNNNFVNNNNPVNTATAVNNDPVNFPAVITQATTTVVSNNNNPPPVVITNPPANVQPVVIQTQAPPTAPAPALTPAPAQAPAPAQSRQQQCYVRSCDQSITGRNLEYDRALQIVQNEEYLSAAGLNMIHISESCQTLVSHSYWIEFAVPH